jgi:hypothetical protein
MHQVSSALFPPLPNLRCHGKQGEPRVPEVVRVQRLLLEDNPLPNSPDIETWNFAHILNEYVSPESNMKMLQLRFANDDKEDVMEGAVYRLFQVKQRRPQKP